MTTHDKDKIIAAAKESGITYSGTTPEIFDSQDMLTSFYAIAFEDAAASRDAEIAKLRQAALDYDKRWHEEQVKCDQLREQVKMLRDVLTSIRDRPLINDVVHKIAVEALAATEPK